MKKLLFLLALCAALQSCGGGDDPAPGDPPDACTADAQRRSLTAWMQDQYYWYPQLGAAAPGAPDMDTYFRSMVPNPPDRYSFSQTTASFDQFFNSGWRIGYGYTLVWDAASAALRVRNVEPESPVAAAGIRRGDRVLAIDGFTAQQVMAGLLPNVDAAGVNRRFLLADAGGGQREVTVRSALFGINALATWSTLDAMRGNTPVKVGYMAYHQFVAYSAWSLALATSRMAAQGVSELVVDLRYNGGGAVNTSRDLASMITGSRTDGATYAQLRFNGKHPQLDQDIPFMTGEQRYTAPIEGLNRVIVITSGNTASASEMLINGLRPYVQVVLVGERTYGKPYGFVPRSACGTTYSAVNFETFNSQGAGGYAAGMPTDCQVADDLDHELGDPAERRLKEALGYIATGRCSIQPQSARLAPLAAPTVPQVFGETVPPQMFLDGR